MINEDFNYIIVTLSILISIVGAFLAKRYASQSILHRLFENKEVVTSMWKIFKFVNIWKYHFILYF